MAAMNTHVLHIHPTRMCNLACAHCYSTSGPAQRETLSTGEILGASERLLAMGYTQASLSGGEPLLYPEIEGLCAGLTDLGYKVSMISNGWFPERLLALCHVGTVHTASISFDGPPCLHDTVRRRKGAFDKALDTLSRMTSAGHRCGTVVAVTRDALPHLPDLVAHLVRAGAAQILLHPVAAVGRAAENPVLCTELTEEQILRLLLLKQAFGQLYPEVPFACDAATGIDIGAAELGREGGLISPLVLEETGRLMPFAYGIDDSLSLGSLQDGHAAPVITPALSRLVHRTQLRCAKRLATAFYPELVAQSRQAA